MGKTGITLWKDRRGAAATLIALSMTALTGAAAVSVDLGSIYLAKRQLQGVADSAVLAAAGGNIASTGTSSAQSIIQRSGVAGVEINALTPGKYVRDEAVPVDARFVAGPTHPSAARLTLEREVPLFFGKVILGKSTLNIRATATAARVDVAAFSIGSRLASLSGGLANDLLSSLAGTNLQLSVLDGQSLLSANMDILHFADALRVRVGSSDATYAELFDMDIPISDLVRAMADAAPMTGARDAYQRAASHLGATKVRLADLIDLGPLGDSSSHTGDTQLIVDALSLLRSVLEQSQGQTYASTTNLGIPGLASVKVKMVGGGGMASSPWMTVTDAKDVIVRTGRMRIYLETGVASIISGIATIRVPVYVELAAAEARLSDIRCEGNAMTDGVTLAVTPSIGSAAIADIDATSLANFSQPMALQPALLAQVPLLGTKVRASSNVLLGGTQAQNVHFTKSDIASNTTRTVSTNDLLTGIAASLLSHVQVTATTLGLTISTGPLVSAVGGQLGVIAPTLDSVLNDLTGLLGVRLGSADVRVNKMRCGVPVLVA